MLRAALAVLALAAVAGAADFTVTGKDFRCILDGKPVEGKTFYVFHRNKQKLRKALKIANRDLPNKHYPVGTILQLFPFEAMVKHARSFNPAADGWEFLQLSVSAGGTSILHQGKAEVANLFGSCQGCHSRASRFDFVCEGHGIGGVPFTPDQIRTIQAADPRCQPR